MPAYLIYNYRDHSDTGITNSNATITVFTIYQVTEYMTFHNHKTNYLKKKITFLLPVSNN